MHVTLESFLEFNCFLFFQFISSTRYVGFGWLIPFWKDGGWIRDGRHDV